VGLCTAHLGERHHFFIDVETSTAGFMVSVMISVDGISTNAFDLRQGAKTDERDIFVQNEIGRNRFEIFAELPDTYCIHITLP
jgi:hypothetical protein